MDSTQEYVERVAVLQNAVVIAAKNGMQPELVEKLQHLMLGTPFGTVRSASIRCLLPGCHKKKRMAESTAVRAQQPPLPRRDICRRILQLFYCTGLPVAVC